MNKPYYILSTKYSLRERQSKRGKVYDVRFLSSPPISKNAPKKAFFC